MAPLNKAKSAVASAAPGKKRQMSLFEMGTKVVPGPAAADQAPANKRAKVQGPFTREAFRATLSSANPTKANAKPGDTVSERDLLALECDTMGEAWLEQLAPELVKPSFLAVKRQLWNEGLRGVEVAQTKIFPPGK